MMSYFTFTFLFPAFLIWLIKFFFNFAVFIFFDSVTFNFVLVPFSAPLPKLLNVFEAIL